MNIKFYESEMRMIPGVHVPLRSTLIPLHNRSILIAPIDFSEEQLQDIRSKATVTDIVAPNLFHNLHIDKAIKHFPQATLWGVPGFEKKRPDLPWKKFLGIDEWPYTAELEFIVTQGAPGINEAVFFHPASKTLVVTDLFFNIENPKGFLAPIAFRLMGTYKKFAVSSLWNRAAKDVPSFAQSMQKIMKWDFHRIVMAHGTILEQDAHENFKQALLKRKLSNDSAYEKNRGASVPEL